MLDSSHDILGLTESLVNIESIVNTEGEAVIAQKLYQYIASLPYFRENPHLVFKKKTIKDHMDRYNVFATVKGTKSGKNNKTVILLGHTDTVGIDDFEHLKEKACFPQKLMKALSVDELPDLVQQHLDSDEWYFGRGTLDMKSGLASNLYLLKYYSENPEKLSGNLMVLAECDEEDSSNGILSALTDLIEMKKTHQYDYVGLINADFVAPLYNGDENRYIYKGTIGKLLPSFYIKGAESHVGSPFSGLDPNFIAAELTRQISYNPELCDVYGDEMTAPPVSLKQVDLKPSYTVQTALAAFVYFNFFTYTSTPQEVLIKLKEQAEIAFANAIKSLNKRYHQYNRQNGELENHLSWEPNVVIYEDMHRKLIEEYGDEFVNHMENFKEQLLHDDTLDTRMYTMKVVEEESKWLKDKSPVIILFYSSLHSPHLKLTGKDEDELNLLNALEEAIAEVQPHYHYPIVQRDFFPYISDMSFVSMDNNTEGIKAVKQNSPAWGKKLYVNYDDILELDIPAINIGPYGYDAHSKFERMETDYSTKIVPNITNKIIQQLIG